MQVRPPPSPTLDTAAAPVGVMGLGVPQEPLWPGCWLLKAPQAWGPALAYQLIGLGPRASPLLGWSAQGCHGHLISGVCLEEAGPPHSPHGEKHH